MRTAVASAPGKLMLLGDHSVVYGSNCLVTAVEQRLTVSVSTNTDSIFALTAPEQGLDGYHKAIAALGEGTLPKPVQFLEVGLRNFFRQYPTLSTGITVVTKSEFSSTFGFGSSSAVTVAFLQTLHALFELPFTERDIFTLGYQTVLDIQGVGSGFDIASATWGKTLRYGQAGKTLDILDQAPPLMVVYTGVKADTATLVRQVAEQKRQEPQRVGDILTTLGELVEPGSQALTNSDWPHLGEIFNQAQQLLVQLGVSSERIDQLIAAALQAGAYGAKLSGAGGGDCIIILCPENSREAIVKSVTALGGVVLPVALHAQGVRNE